MLTTDLWKEFLAEVTDEKAVQAARELNRAYDAGFISMREFLDGVKEVTGRSPKRVEELLEDKGEIIKNEQLLTYIGELRHRGYKIGLLSNIATNWIRDTFLTLEEQALFDDMVMSFKVGMVKPDRRIFQLACERLSVESTEAAFVDDIDRYCEAAEAEGIKAIVYTDFKQMQSELESVLEQKQ